MHVSSWIAEWIWHGNLQKHGRTIIVLDAERPGVLVGYGTWKHVVDLSSVLRPTSIEIAWFGIHSDYQGRLFDEVHMVAEVVYAEVERDASEHTESTSDMAITLVCHVNNHRGLKFWRRMGFRLVGEPNPQIEKDVYYRLVR